MNKVIKIYLIGIFFLISGINFNQNVKILNSNEINFSQQRPFYKNIDQNFNNYNADVKKTNGDSNSSTISDIGTVLSWNLYTSSWNEFVANYRGLDLTVHMEVAFNWYNIKWSNSSLYIPLNKISKYNLNWTEITHIEQTTTQWGRWDVTNSRLSYVAWVSGNSVLIRFKLDTWASNDYDNYYFSIDTRRVSTPSSFNYDSIKSIFNQKVNNQNLILDSNYSTSLQDNRNMLASQVALNNLIKGALGNYYEVWKPYIGSFVYNAITNQATITIKFNDPNTNAEVMWIFKVNIKFNLTQNYWNKTFKQRLTITPGKIIDPTNPNSQMVLDTPLKWDGRDVYGTTAFIRFDAAPDGSETMKINSIPIQVINNQFTFQMTDNQSHATNEYHILLEKHNLSDFTKIIGKYEIKYLIKQNIPQLDLKWYAWDPNKNPDQKNLITPTLENGKQNLDYDREVNLKTGTKTQIMWIKQKANHPFSLDPLNQKGDIITDNNYDQGYLVEGAVSGMGITQTFSDPWIKSITRLKLNNVTLQPIGTPEAIKSDDQGSYFSLEGTYLYTITDQKGAATSKMIIIGQKWQSKYAKFLDVLNNSNIAVPFWSTLQGYHLKNYLVQYKQFNSKNILSLSFEEVSSYWKEYVSNVKTQHIGPSIQPIDNIDLNNINLNDIKMNTKEITKVRSIIINNIARQLETYQLKYNVDYQIVDLEAMLHHLLNFDSNNNAIVKLTIKALNTSIIARNCTFIRVRNSTDYLQEKVIDLSKIKFENYHYNFSKFTGEQLKQWILQAITNKFKSIGLGLNYLEDYEVKSLEEDILSTFINSKDKVSITIMIAANLSSNKAVNRTELKITNDPEGTTAPIIPPINKPEPDKVITPKQKQQWIEKTQNLIFLSIGVITVVILTFSAVFLKNRFRKGIGGKKVKNKSNLV